MIFFNNYFPLIITNFFLLFELHYSPLETGSWKSTAKHRNLNIQAWLLTSSSCLCHWLLQEIELCQRDFCSHPVFLYLNSVLWFFFSILQIVRLLKHKRTKRKFPIFFFTLVYFSVCNPFTAYKEERKQKGEKILWYPCFPEAGNPASCSLSLLELSFPSSFRNISCRLGSHMSKLTEDHGRLVGN